MDGQSATIHHPRVGQPSSQGWSPTIQNLQEGSVLHTSISTYRFDSQNQCQVTPSLGQHFLGIQNLFFVPFCQNPNPSTTQTNIT